jgi:hypothetical protein
MKMELIRSISIQSLVWEHDRIVRFLEQSFTEYQEIKSACKFCELDYVAIGTSRYSHSSWVQTHQQKYDVYLIDAKLRLRAQMWRKLIDESGMKTFMGAKAISEWDEMVIEPSKFKDLPEITVDNIQATFEALHKDKGTMFNRAVIDVFKALSWDYKSNIPHKFGKKVILGFIYAYGKHASKDKINDLERAFFVLDGRNVPDWRDAAGTQIHDKACKFGGTKPMQFEFDYFNVKTFKNGNAHVVFTQPGLVDQLNKIIATAYPSCLPPKVYKAS